ncbi:16S rRNA (guanine(527)-N(7))-methyltransferase RsmG [Hahella sp. KA22]|uniref:16S rRNA (guanine(527)-N(7))-methyltransferase RsmG n=1 Tax=Hahella sp. KA22 TaxID=1628392 RepID=UPI000FDDB45D|nr:16S rRNA (guanine(527)-N(7))-methyltransferase RsmG [Hahella sp. KA22]AZZ95362.1 16S rRNA (guanine(527)-N(7))-methyltransferase RsmG [Hahella sp. KA22]QAY53007.1 16S rRNA (guanine(527)-N(7))-methyltransferase RsmG [Hahella sp. KA22]
MALVLNQTEQLTSGLKAMGVSLAEAQQIQILRYLELLHKWNKAYNLTAVRDPALHVSRHILDSLAALPYLKGAQFLDVGAGAGLPGIPLSIAQPDSHWTLLDSNGKKTRFMDQCRMDMGLTNLRVEHTRIEAFTPDAKFDGIISRAFATIGDMIAGCRDLILPETRIYALKGLYPHDEIEAMPADFEVVEWHKLEVPGCDGERHLLIIARSGNTGGS